MSDAEKIDRNATLNIIKTQHAELYKQSQNRAEILLATVTCPCGRERGITRAVRCLYCDVWYCELCAEIHFGETRAERRLKSKNIAALGQREVDK